jgi:hypothetical protein
VLTRRIVRRVVEGFLIVVRAFAQNVPAHAGFSQPRAALRVRGPPRVLGLDRVGRGCARCARLGHAGRTGFLVLVIFRNVLMI